MLFTGFGGQVDFIRGAAEGFDGKGKPIIAMQSTNEKTGESKISAFLKPGKFFSYVNAKTSQLCCIIVNFVS